MPLAKKLPSQGRLKQLFVYNKTTGVLRWRKKPSSKRSFGLIAGHIHDKGYLRVGINGQHYFVHRIIWKIVKGTEPTNIDHKNNVKNDNRWVNLRRATFGQNRYNTLTPKNNTSGYKGVSFDKRKKKFAANIARKRVVYHLGMRTSAKAAHLLYVAKAKELFRQYANDGTHPCL